MSISRFERSTMSPPSFSLPRRVLMVTFLPWVSEVHGGFTANEPAAHD